MVGRTTGYLRDKESRVMKKCKANRGEALLKDMLDSQKLSISEIGHVADTRYEDKYKGQDLAKQVSLPDPSERRA